MMGLLEDNNGILQEASSVLTSLRKGDVCYWPSDVIAIRFGLSAWHIQMSCTGRGCHASIAYSRVRPSSVHKVIHTLTYFIRHAARKATL